MIICKKCPSCDHSVELDFIALCGLSGGTATWKRKCTACKTYFRLPLVAGALVSLISILTAVALSIQLTLSHAVLGVTAGVLCWYVISGFLRFLFLRRTALVQV